MLRVVDDDGFKPEDDAYAQGVLDGYREREPGNDDRRRPPWWVVAVLVSVAALAGVFGVWVMTMHSRDAPGPEVNQQQDVDQDVSVPGSEPTAKHPTSPVAVEREPEQPPPQPEPAPEPPPAEPAPVPAAPPAPPAQQQPVVPEPPVVVDEPVTVPDVPVQQPTGSAPEPEPSPEPTRRTPVRDLLCALLCAPEEA